MATPTPITSLQRGLQILDAVQRSSAMSFTELREETGLPKATLARLLHTLTVSGWIRRQGPRGRYVCETRPGLQPAEQDRVHQFAKLAQSACAKLQRAVPWPVNLGIRDGASMLIVEPPDAVVMGLAANYRQLGFRPPMLRSSLGLCYLAFCPEDERSEILQRLQRSTDEFDRTVLRSGRLAQRLQEVRQQGYALRDISIVPMISSERYGAMSVPVASKEKVHACLSCSWLLQIASTEETIKLCLQPLHDAASSLARQLDRLDMMVAP